LSTITRVAKVVKGVSVCFRRLVIVGDQKAAAGSVRQGREVRGSHRKATDAASAR